MEQPRLQLDQLRFDVPGETILDRISLEVEPGTFVCLLGPSGCGKTTLLRLIGGLLEPTGGSVRLAGVPPHQGWHHAAYVFQTARLCGWRTVAQNVALGMELRQPGLPAAEQRRRIDRYLQMTRLEERRDHLAGNLSGGEAQRVALARALAVESPLLLMDEPFANLDVATRRHLRDALSEIWLQTRRTILFVTHDIEEALALGDRLVVLSGRPATVLADYAVTAGRPRTGHEPELMELRRRVNALFGCQPVMEEVQP